MNVLIVNDDGIDAKGISLLEDKVKKYANVYVVAPIVQQSGMSQAISIRSKFDVKVLSEKKIAFGGTPADCVKYGTYKFSDVEFDFIFSGVNDGPNLGDDIFYSGTVGAATEGAFMGYKSVAFSCGKRDNWLNVEKGLDLVLTRIFNGDIPFNESAININFPADSHLEINGMKFTQAGKKYYRTVFTEDKECTSNTLINTYEVFGYDEREDTDIHECHSGYITITPLVINRTDKEYLKKVAE